MKRKLVFSIMAVAGLSLIAFRPADPESLEIGAKAPRADVKMISVDGEAYSLNELLGNNGLLVIFSCNTCPFVIGAEGYGEGWEARYSELSGDCKKAGVGMILVNSNEGKRDKGDNLMDMKARAEAQKFDHIPYVIDRKSELANAFGARTTPHVFLFDKNLKLVYKGAIDDNNESPAKVKEHWLKNALVNLSSGKSISPAETKPVGCSIKRAQ
jgi:hypothetical protein